MESENTDWVTDTRKRLREKRDDELRHAAAKEAERRAIEEAARLAKEAAIREAHGRYESDLTEIKAAVRTLVPTLGLDEIVWVEFSPKGANACRMGPVPVLDAESGSLLPSVPVADLHYHQRTTVCWSFTATYAPPGLMDLCRRDLHSWCAQVGLETSVRQPYGKNTKRIKIPFTNCEIGPENDRPLYPDEHELATIVVVGLRVAL